MEKTKGLIIGLAGTAVVAACLFSATAQAGNDKATKRAAIFDYWTAERRAAAQPRDLVIDPQGFGYLRRADGSLVAHGSRITAVGVERPQPNAGPGDNDTTAPTISNLDPADGATIGAAYTFSATVTDNVGLRSVKFIITKQGGRAQSFDPSDNGNGTWSLSLSGFTDGNWAWEVDAKDTAKGGGNVSTATASFVVNSGGGGDPGSGDTVTNAQWTGGGDAQTAVGRIFFEMPSNPNLRRWAGYVCSGTVVTDGATGRSVILTASHCVYDDANKAFARNVLFIPDQANTTGSGTDSNCANDPIGCWVADFGVVDVNWTTRTFPDNVAWDYAFYVVDDNGAHQAGLNSAPDALDGAASAMTIDFTAPAVDDGSAGAGTPDFTFGMGYSYSDDPNFMYCAEDMTTEGAVNWWIPSCGLSGGSSGGSMAAASAERFRTDYLGEFLGLHDQPGMAGPILSGTSAQCVFDAAIINGFPANQPADGDAGYAINCP